MATDYLALYRRLFEMPKETAEPAPIKPLPAPHIRSGHFS